MKNDSSLPARLNMHIKKSLHFVPLDLELLLIE